MDVLSEAMEAAGKDYAEVLPLMRKDNGKPLSERQVKRYLAGTHYPTGRGVDLWTRAVAKVTGTKDRFSFYRTAIELAESEARSGRAVRAAKKARKKSPAKSPRKRDPKAKTNPGG